MNRAIFRHKHVPGTMWVALNTSTPLIFKTTSDNEQKHLKYEELQFIEVRQLPHGHRKKEAGSILRAGCLPSLSSLWECHIQNYKMRLDWQPGSRLWIALNSGQRNSVSFWHKLKIVTDVGECDTYEVLETLPWKYCTGRTWRRRRSKDADMALRVCQ